MSIYTRNILLLSANPKGTSQLRLESEMRDIKEGLRLSENRDLFSISTASAIRPRDIRRAILTYKPHIIHFSGHGSQEFVNIKSQQINLEQLFTLAPTESGIFSGYLRQLLWHLQHNSPLKVGYKKVVRANAPVRLDAEVAFKLHSLGLVKLSGNDCLPSCDLYRQYFQFRLG